MGLLEIASPSSIENVSEDQCYYTIYFKPSNTSTMVRVPAGLYKRGNLLVDALHSLFYVCGVNKTSSELSLTKTKINEYINEILNTEQ